MKFFVPFAADEQGAESVYDSFAKFVGATVPQNNNQRIASLSWRHNGKDMVCEVGKPLPTYYQTGEQPVLAIFDCGNVYKICIPYRGGIRGEPVLAGKDLHSKANYFSE